MMKFKISDETSQLKTVILGSAYDRGTITYKNNPKSKEQFENGTYPTEQQLCDEYSEFEKILLANGVKVLKPENIPNKNQQYPRDIGFVIENFFIKANMKKDNRKPEYEAIKYLVDKFPKEKVLYPPEDAIIEGGDIVLFNEYVFVGQSDRTNKMGYDFLKQNFSDKKVIPLEVTVTKDPMTNVLHLDCAFQPVGEKYAIIYEQGFVKRPNIIYDLFGKENLIKVSSEEMYKMFPNIFSISANKVISEKGFERLNTELRKKGIEVFEVPFAEASKTGGLFRCSTLPLERL